MKQGDTKYSYYTAKSLVVDILGSKERQLIMGVNKDSSDYIIKNYKNYYSVILSKKIKDKEDEINKFKINPINIKELKSIVIFSANPSVETPVSIISIEYLFNNHGNEFKNNREVKNALISIYNNDEIFEINKMLGHVYIKKTGVLTLGYDSLKP